MITRNQDYRNTIDRLQEIKKQELSKVVNFGKYKGLTIEQVMSRNPQYVEWLIRDTQFEIDPLILGYRFPTKGDILEAVKWDAGYAEITKDGIKILRRHYTPPVYDNWNVGHHGCTSPTLVKPESTTYSEYTFTIEEAYQLSIRKLKEKFGFVPWTLEYFKDIVYDNSETKGSSKIL